MAWTTSRPDVTCDTPIQCPITGIVTPLDSTNDQKLCKLILPGPLFIRIILWLLVFAVFPLSVTSAVLSFRVEVLGSTIPGALPAERSMPLAERVLVRLEAAEQKESDLWLRDDIRIAWITVLYASRGNAQPHIDATYKVLGIHPHKVWPAICARRAALLGSKSLPHNKKQPMAANRDGNAPQKTCAYGAETDHLTGSSCRTETKREARRIRTSEFGLHDAPPAGVAAPADNTSPKKPSQSVQESHTEGVA